MEARDLLLQQMQSLKQRSLLTPLRDGTATSAHHTLSNMQGNRVRSVDGWTPQAWRTSCKRWTSLLRSPHRSVSTSWLCWAHLHGYARDYHVWWEDAAKKSGSLQSALAETNQRGGCHSQRTTPICLFFELEKFHDSECLHKLIELALEAMSPSGCFTEPCTRTPASASSVQVKWCSQACS